MSDIVYYEKLELPPTQKSLEFSPPPRFGTTSFSEFSPQHPSQATATTAVQAFVESIGNNSKSQGWFWQKATPAAGKGLYLDGGFGVGKTHLLASAYHAAITTHPPEHIAYLSFQELVYAIGMLGIPKAKTELTNFTLYCIDEFELDDPGNTLMVKTFLKEVFAKGNSVLTTSNTPPHAQGQGRFNASYFQREIQSIAAHFEILQMEGPDYRKRKDAGSFVTVERLERHLQQTTSPTPKVVLNWTELFTVLQELHPIRYHSLLKQIGTLYIKDASTIASQNDALRFAHFIDKVYDLKVCCRVTPATPAMELTEIYSTEYVNGAFAKKYDRSLSRLAEMLEEKCT